MARNQKNLSAWGQKLRRALDEVRDHIADFERRKKEFAEQQAAEKAAAPKKG